MFPDDWKRIEAARFSIVPEKLVVASFAWEHWVKSGGLAAVGLRLCDALRKHPSDRRLASGFPKVFRFGPLHRKLLPPKAESKLQHVADTSVIMNGQNIGIKVFRLTADDGTDWFLFEDSAQDFFQADGGRPSAGRLGREPYFYSAEDSAEKRDGLDSKLLGDVLFAAKAAPAVLAAVGLRENLIVHAHDWTFFLLAVTVKQELARASGLLKSAAVVGSLHNPFDHMVRTGRANRLSSLAPTIPDSSWVFPFEVRTGYQKSAPDTVLESAIGLLDAPVAIVSPGFASELCGTRLSPRDPLQRYHFAPHLASLLRYQGAVGIQNANFYPEESWSTYEPEAVDAVLRRGETAAMLQEKRHRRISLSECAPTPAQSGSQGFGRVRLHR